MYSQRYNDNTEEQREEPYRSGRYSMQPSLPMLRNSALKLKNNSNRERFVTIDDLLPKAEELVSGLKKLTEYKHPLDVRRGVGSRKEVEDMVREGDSKTVKAGSKTYFLDIKETRGEQPNPYLVITESRFKGQGKENERASIVVFQEHAQELLKAIQEMVAKLG